MLQGGKEAVKDDEEALKGDVNGEAFNGEAMDRR